MVGMKVMFAAVGEDTGTDVVPLLLVTLTDQK
jgi:hypothetical protein